MKIKLTKLTRLRRSLGGFSLIETTVGAGLFGTVVLGLFSGFSAGFFSMQMARENLRATQILLEKTETIRLYSWDQVNSNGFIPTTFTATYDPKSTNSGLVYTGRLTITNAPINAAYSNDIKQITVSVNWTTGTVPRQRSFTTFIARDGLQNYIY